MTNNCPLCNPVGERVIWRGKLIRVIDASDDELPGFVRVIVKRHAAEMTDLTEMETYRVRAYAISPEGVEYGEVEQFIFADPEYAAYLSFPTFKHDGHTYRVYPDLGEEFEWEEANALCENLTYAGYDDWMLPSKDVLMTMYLYKDDIGGFRDADYWSSSNFVSGCHYHVDFRTGLLDWVSSSTGYVRPIRLEK